MAGKPLRSVKRPPIQVGNVFGDLTVVSISNPDKNGQTHWNCRCKCGTMRRAAANNLKRGNTTNCGCNRDKRIQALNLTHGLSHLPEHAHWCNMFSRVKHNPDYEGRYICKRWRESFEAFLEDMGSKPTTEHELDRINNNGNYTCGHCEECYEKGDAANCQWSTFTQQMRNTRRSHYAALHGRVATIGEWSEILQVPYHVVYERVKRGLPVDGT